MMALFGVKFGDIVRTIKISRDSLINGLKLCDGNHVSTTSIIASFYITAEFSVGQGIHRNEAVT